MVFILKHYDWILVLWLSEQRSCPSSLWQLNFHCIRGESCLREFLAPSQVRWSRWRIASWPFPGIQSCFCFLFSLLHFQATVSLYTCVLGNCLMTLPWLKAFFLVGKKDPSGYLCPSCNSNLLFQACTIKESFIFVLSPIFLLSAHCRPMELPYPFEYLTSLNNSTIFSSSTCIGLCLPLGLNLSGIYPSWQTA